MTQAELADLVGTAQSTIYRLETGERKLTVQWMQKIARALNVEPMDLLSVATAAGLDEDAAPYVSADPAISPAMLAQRGLAHFKIASNVVERTGLHPGDVILIDMTPGAVENLTTGDIVVAQVYDAENFLKATTIVRLFVAPSLLTTNRRGSNTAFDMESAPFEVAIKGVRVRN